MAKEGRPGKHAKGARIGRRVGIAALVVVGALFLLFLLAAAFVASPLFERTLQSEVLPRVSKTLEREVTVESAKGSLIPLGILLRGFRMAGLTERPILVAEEIEVLPRVWPTVRSLGRVIGLKRFRMQGMEANLVRLEDGEWDLPTIPERPPEKPKTEFRVDDATIESGVARVIDPSQDLEFETTDIFLSASLSETVGALKSLRAAMAGGRIQAGARALLSGETPSWAADMQISSLDLAALPPLTGTMEGIMSGDVRVAGEGQEKAAVFSSLTGSGRMTLLNGKWINKTFLEDLATEIAEFIYVPKGAGPEAEDALDLGSPVRAEAEVRDGWVTITRPPRIRASFGGAEISGRVSLEKQLDLLVDIGLSTEFLSELTGGLVEPEEPVPVTLRVQGTVDNPDIELIDTAELSDLDPGFLRRLFQSIKNLLPGGD